MKIGRWICEKLCGHKPLTAEDKEILPDSVRNQSHAVSNRASEIQAVSHRIYKDVKTLAVLAENALEARSSTLDDNK